MARKTCLPVGTADGNLRSPFGRDDERAAAIIANTRKAITSEGRLIVVEIVLPPGNEPHVVPLIDLNMMVMTGGIERTEARYGQLLARAGFRLAVSTKSPFSVIDGVARVRLAGLFFPREVI